MVYRYFVSYHRCNPGGAWGVGRATINFKKEIEDEDDIVDITRYIENRLDGANAGMTVTVLFYQLMKEVKDKK